MTDYLCECGHPRDSHLSDRGQCLVGVCECSGFSLLYGGTLPPEDPPVIPSGISRRDYFAGVAMQTMLGYREEWTYDVIVQQARFVASLLIAELDKPIKGQQS